MDKLNYLRAQLDGPAQEAIAGLELTNNNYQVALDNQKQRFGRENLVRETLYLKLFKLRVSSNDTKGLRTALTEIEKIRSLAALGSSIEHEYMLLVQVKSKFPGFVIRHLEMMKKCSDPWTLKELRNDLHTYI